MAVVAAVAVVAVAALPVMLIPAVPALILAAVRLVSPDPFPLIVPALLTTRFDEIVTAWPDAPIKTALLIVQEEDAVCAWLQLFSLSLYAVSAGRLPDATFCHTGNPAEIVNTFPAPPAASIVVAPAPV